MISFEQDATISSGKQNTNFTDDELDIDISHRSLCANKSYLGFDVLYDKINVDRMLKFDQCAAVNIDIINFIKNSFNYINSLSGSCVCIDMNISDEEITKMINFYNNSFTSRKYPYTIRSAKTQNDAIIKYKISIIEKYLVQLSSVYYLGESKSEQDDVVNEFYNAIKYDYYSKNILANNNSVIISYDTEEFSNPFFSKDFIKEIGLSVSDKLNPIAPYITRVYNYKTFRDINKGIIKPTNSRLENAICLAYFFFIINVEFFLRNHRDSIDVFIDYYEGYKDQSKPIFIPSIYEYVGNNYEEPAFSEESGEGEDGKASGVKVDSNYKRKSEELYKIYLSTVKLAKYNIQRFFNSMFFKKYYGRIPSLYDRYGNDAKVAENTLNGDPTDILKNDGVKYIQDMSKDAVDLFNEIIDMATKVANATDYNTKLSVIKNYCKRFPISNDTQINVIDDCIRKETIYRIAASIFRDIKIYGFSVEGVVENGKFPPANHIVVSLFTENPHEQPQDIAVTSIFNSADNIVIYAKPDLGNFFNDVYKKVANNIMQGLNIKGIEKTSGLLAKSSNDFAHNIKAKIKSGVMEKDKNIKNEQKAIKMINKGLEQSIEIVWLQKKRCMQCVSVMLDMTQRIILLAKKCVVAMLAVEKQAKDERHDTGFKAEQTNKTHSGTTKSIKEGLQDTGHKDNKNDEEMSKYADDKTRYQNGVKTDTGFRTKRI